MSARPVVLLCLLLLLSLAGCAGYRGGWESLAYLGDTPPDTTGLAELPEFRRPPLEVPGLELAVTIDNQLRTYDTHVYLFVLPLYVNPREVYRNNQAPGRTRVYITVTPRSPGFVFRPEQAVLGFAGKRFAGSAGFEFGQWDAQGNPVTQGGRWEHEGRRSGFVLGEVGRRYLLSIDFVTPVPSPQWRDITVDLSQALSAPNHPPLPLIRFVPLRWKQGYT